MAQTLIYGDDANLITPREAVAREGAFVQQIQPVTSLKIRTVFPFVLFPDDLIVDDDKVTIIRRTFFASEEIHTIPIKDVMDVIVAHNLFFATLYIKRAFQNDLYELEYLKKEEALRARQLIQELVSRLPDKK